MCKRFSLLFAALLLHVVSGCNLLGLQTEDEVGFISICFLEGTDEVFTKASSGVKIDTNDFILTVTSSSGDVLYSGKYSEAPLSIAASEGKYVVRAESAAFTRPAFDSPQWGDEQTVTISPGKTTSVTLVCRQINCGVRLSVSSDFLTVYPGSSLLLKSSSGTLLYSYSERRTAYFPAGNVSLVLSTGGEDENILTRSLSGGEILSLNVSVSEKTAQEAGSEDFTGASIRVRVDTSRTYLDENVVVGEGSDDASSGWESAYTIALARSNVGKKAVWVGGFIVGGDLTSTGISFDEPFKSNTNLAIGPKSNTRTRSDCLSVQLQSGQVRDELNLSDNPSVLHRYVYLKGDIVQAYYGLVGMKNITDYKLK